MVVYELTCFGVCSSQLRPLGDGVGEFSSLSSLDRWDKPSWARVVSFFVAEVSVVAPRFWVYFILNNSCPGKICGPVV